MSIIPAGVHDAERIAALVSESNRDVADRFGLNRENNPKHPSFYTREWVLSDLARGEQYFLFHEAGLDQGCVAYEQPDADTAYLNRLSVLPAHRRAGIGEKLVRHIVDVARARGVRLISIGIIAHHEQLKRWYARLGFREIRTTTFDHLPFDVTYMHYRLD